VKATIALRVTIALVCLGVTAWASYAQQTTPPPSVPLETRRAGARAAGNTTVLETPGYDVSRRHFEPGARMFWHSHSGGQLLLNQEGRSLVQERGKPIRELGPGESMYTPPNVPHWHGATAKESSTLLSVGFPGVTTWMEEVTDAEYAGREQ
jgi:quercetin dioxygenase-like cupin family protein